MPLPSKSSFRTLFLAHTQRGLVLFASSTENIYTFNFISDYLGSPSIPVLVKQLVSLGLLDQAEAIAQHARSFYVQEIPIWFTALLFISFFIQTFLISAFRGLVVIFSFFLFFWVDIFVWIFRKDSIIWFFIISEELLRKLQREAELLAEKNEKILREERALATQANNYLFAHKVFGLDISGIVLASPTVVREEEGAELESDETIIALEDLTSEFTPETTADEKPETVGFFERNAFVVFWSFTLLLLLILGLFYGPKNYFGYLGGTERFLAASGDQLQLTTEGCSLLLVFCTVCRVFSDWLNMSVKFIYEQLFLSTFFLVFNFLILHCVSLLSLFSSIVGLNICLYSIIGQAKAKGSTEAAIKYLVLGVVTLAFFLLGVLFLLAEGCVISFISFLWRVVFFSIITSFTNNSGTILIFLGLFFKLALFPFINWVADVFDGSSIFAILFLIFTKIAIITILTITVESLASLDKVALQLLFILSAVGSVVWGSVASIFEQKIKRFLAFSGVSHAGFLLGGSSLRCGVQYVSIGYMVVYAFTNTIFLLLGYGFRHEDLSSGLVYVGDLSQVSSQNLAFYWGTVNSLFSLSGLPPFIGFFAKFSILVSLSSTVTLLPLCVMFFFVAFSPVSAFNYIRVIKAMFFSLVEKTIKLFLPFQKYESIYLSSTFLFFFGGPFWVKYLFCSCIYI